MKLKVIKKDGTIESYIHTKILKTLCCCLAGLEDNISTAESLAEAFTFHIYSKEESVFTTCEIHSMLKAILFETGFDIAAVRLHQHHYQRILKRNRIEVIDIDVDSMNNAVAFTQMKEFNLTNRWDKSAVVKWLIEKHNIENIDARAIASTVEEKIIALNSTVITTGQIKQFALIETVNFKSMQLTEEPKKKQKKQKPIEELPAVMFDADYKSEKEAVLV